MWQKPERDEWGSGVEALDCALQLEKNVNQSLLDLHKVASDHNDPHVSAYMQVPKVLWANRSYCNCNNILFPGHTAQQCLF